MHGPTLVFALAVTTWAAMVSTVQAAADDPGRTPGAKAAVASATIHCKVTLTGDLTECKVVSETPPGHDVGEQTLKLSKKFKMHPAMRDGHPVEGWVTIPVKWKLDDTPAAPQNQTADHPAQGH